MVEIMATSKAGEILDRYRVENGFSTLTAFEDCFNEKMGEDGFSRQTFHSWRTGKTTPDSRSRPRLRLAKMLYAPYDWRYRMAAELLTIK